MKHYDELESLERATRRLEALSLALIAMSEFDLKSDYLGEVGEIAANEAKAANATVGRLFEAMRKENASGEAGVEDFANNGDLAGAPYGKS